jgi:hypothetical protein
MKAQMIALVGIDGSGKSTLTRLMPHLLTGQRKQVFGGVGDGACAIAPNTDLALPDFYPRGLPLSLRLSRIAGRWAKTWIAQRRVYAFLKLLQLILQDLGAQAFAKRYGVEVLFCDGHPLISAAARAGNCFDPASTDPNAVARCDGQSVAHNLRYLMKGSPFPEGAARLPWIRALRWIHRFTSFWGMPLFRFPDAVVFLDVREDEAQRRIEARGKTVDPHENHADLRQARLGYRRALAAFAQVSDRRGAIVLPIGNEPEEDVAQALSQKLAGRLMAPGHTPVQRQETLHVPGSQLVGQVFLRIVFGWRYLRQLFLNAAAGAWREPLFVLSRSGRIFLREGYSARVMRLIYDGHRRNAGWAERIFLDHPLHVAVSDRLDCLRPRIQEALWSFSRAQKPLRILTAPSGLSDDLFGALEPLKETHGDLLSRLEIVAVDLDPDGSIETSLKSRAHRLGVRLDFLRGDLTDRSFQSRLLGEMPFDIVLFVGLSSWLPKGALAVHLSLLHRLLKSRGQLISDAFAADRYALSGEAAGYRAHYHDVWTWRALLNMSGFSGEKARIQSGRNGINTVFACEKRSTPQKRAA